MTTYQLDPSSHTHTHTHTHIYIYIYIYTHTHTHTQWGEINICIYENFRFLPFKNSLNKILIYIYCIPLICVYKLRLQLILQKFMPFILTFHIYKYFNPLYVYIYIYIYIYKHIYANTHRYMNTYTCTLMSVCAFLHIWS